MVTNLPHPNEFVFVSAAFRLVGFAKAHLRGYSCTTRRMHMKAMPGQLTVEKMAVTSDDTLSEETGNVGNHC